MVKGLAVTLGCSSGQRQEDHHKYAVAEVEDEDKDEDEDEIGLIEGR